MRNNFYINNLEKELKTMRQYERNMDVLFRRAKGETLKSIGNDYGITRERTRQIESVPKKKILKYLSSVENELLEDLAENGFIYDEKALDFFGKKYYLIIKYVIFDNKNSTTFNDNHYYNVKINNKIIYFKNNDELFHLLTNVPSEYFIERNKIYQLKEKIENFGVKNLTNEDIESIFISWNYKKSKEYFYKKNIGIAEAILLITSQDKYKNGIRNNESSASFRELVDIIQNDFKLNVSLKSIKSAISTNLYLWGKSNYINEKFIQYDPKIFEIINNYFEKQIKRQIAYGPLFEKLEKDLKKYTNANNQYRLHGLIEFANKKQFLNLLTSKNYVSTKKILSAEDNFNALSEFLFKKKKPISTNEILNNFPSFNEESIRQAMVYHPEIVKYSSDTFMNINAINFTQGEKEIIKDVSDEVKFFNYVNTKKMFSIIKEKHPNVLKKTFAKTAKAFDFAIKNIMEELGYTCCQPHCLKDYDKKTIDNKDAIYEIFKNTEEKLTKDEFARKISEIMLSDKFNVIVVIDKLIQDKKIKEVNNILKIVS